MEGWLDRGMMDRGTHLPVEEAEDGGNQQTLWEETGGGHTYRTALAAAQLTARLLTW